jgi:hypothetical protein
MSARTRRVLAWVVGGVCLGVVVGLSVVAVLDPDVGDRTASVVGAVVAVAGLALSLITLLVTPAGGGQGTGAVTVRARGRGAVAAGRSVRGNAIGDRARVTGLPTAADPSAAVSRPPGGQDVTARGEGSVSAGEDIVDNAIGEDSER